MISNKDDKINIKELYGEECITPVEEFIKQHNINLTTGLLDSEVQENIKKYGNNELKQNKPKKWYNYLFESFTSPFNLILTGIVIVLFYTDTILTAPPSYANIIVVIFLIIISTFLEFFEVYTSNKAANKLKNLVATTSTVLRNGNKVKIPLKDIVINDIIILSAGDLIPADIRIIESNNLYVTQSSLTGESDTINKVINSNINSIEKIESITDLDNICFMGTNVTSGSRESCCF